MADIGRNDNEGIGRPEPLKYDFAGYWPRRITDEHRLVYKVTDNEVRIAACRYHYGQAPADAHRPLHASRQVNTTP